MELTQLFNNKNIRLNHNDAASILSRKDLLAQSEDLKKELTIMANNVLDSKIFTTKLNDSMMLAVFDGQKTLSLIVDYATVMKWLDDYLKINNHNEELVLNKKFQYANLAIQQSFLFIMIDVLKNKLVRKGFPVNILEKVDESGIKRLSKFIVNVQL